MRDDKAKAIEYPCVKQGEFRAFEVKVCEGDKLCGTFVRAIGSGIKYCARCRARALQPEKKDKFFVQ